MAFGVDIIDETKILQEVVNPITDEQSRYSLDTVYNFQVDETLKFFGTHANITIPVTNSDEYHTVSSAENGRLDLIAFDHYGNQKLSWVIARANDMKDPMFEPIAGTVIRIPSIISLFGNNGALVVNNV